MFKNSLLPIRVYLSGAIDSGVIEHCQLVLYVYGLLNTKSEYQRNVVRLDLGIFILLTKTFLWTITCSNKLQLVLLYEDGSFSHTSEQVPREDRVEEWALNTGHQCRRTRLVPLYGLFAGYWRCIQGFGEETWGKETTWKTQVQTGGEY